jgi:hypothetical protein
MAYTLKDDDDYDYDGGGGDDDALININYTEKL